MDTITILEGTALEHFLAMFAGHDGGAEGIYRLRIWQSGDGSAVKVKVNEGMWTPGLGRKDGAGS